MDQHRSQRVNKIPHPIDIYVGARIKQRRIALGLSQEELAKKLNLAFQQIQKYEHGTNRIAASRLFEISQVLKISISNLFSDVGKDGTVVADGEADEATHDSVGSINTIAFKEGSVLSRSETLRLITNYYRISPATDRAIIYDFIKNMAAIEAQERA